MWPFRESDGAIVRRTLEGQPEAFEPLVFRYQAKAHAIARSLGLRRADADDAVQEAFLQAFRDLPSLREPTSFAAWFLHIVRHVSLKQVRKLAERPVPPVERPSAGPGAAIERADFSEHIWSKVAELPEEVRATVFLFYYQGESIREVARALGISGAGVKKRLRAGRGQLRERLWRELEECLREMLPSTREWRRSGRRIVILLLASVPASWAARAGLAVSIEGSGSAIDFLSRGSALMRAAKRGGLLAGKEKAAAFLALALALVFLGVPAWIVVERSRAAAKQESPAVAKGPVPSARPAAAASPGKGERAAPPAQVRKEAKEDVAPEVEEAPREPTKEERSGRVLVRVIWGDDRTPAAGVWGQVIPWGSPDLYIDERVFVTGADGTVLVDPIFEGGATVMLDRGASMGVKVTPGEESEAVLEIPAGLNVEGEVVDRQGSPVGGARVWVSYGGHTNWGNEVAKTAADGTFFIRSITTDSYIGARAAGHAASDLRQLKAEAGKSARVRIVLGGPCGAIRGVIRDATGEPVENAKVMIGSEYGSYALLEDGATGIGAPPYRWFTDATGEFNADSLPPGKLRVASRASGFAPYEDWIEVEAGRTSELEITLDRGATLGGRVSGDQGQPASGVKLVVGDWKDFLSLKVFSTGDGSYRLTGLPPGEIEVHAERTGWGKSSRRLTVKGSERLRWDPVLTSHLELAGKVVDGWGMPREGYVVLVEERLGDSARKRTQNKLETDALGGFRAGELSDLEYRLLVYEPKCRFPCGLVELRPGPDEVVIEVPGEALASAHIEGSLVDSAGLPVGGAKLICFSAVAGYCVAFTDKETGQFKIGTLPPGTYTVEVQTAAHAPMRLEVGDMKPEETRELGFVSLGAR